VIYSRVLGIRLDSVNPDGAVFSRIGWPRDSVEPDGNLIYMGAAARLLLLRR
jgi:hypothetical protein